MIKRAVGLGTWQQACSHLITLCARPVVENSPLEDAKGSNLSQSETESHSVSKNPLGCESNNTSFENYFRLNSSSGHEEGWKLGPSEAKTKTPADLSRTWLPPKANFSSLSQACQLQTFISIIFVPFSSHQRDPSAVAIQEPLTRWKKFNLQLKKKSINFFPN